jgi:5'-nucleotidase
MTVAGTVDSFTTVYRRNPDGTVSIGVGAPDSEPHALAHIAETPAFLAGYITISPLEVDFRPSAEARERFRHTHRGLAGLAP